MSLRQKGKGKRSAVNGVNGEVPQKLYKNGHHTNGHSSIHFKFSDVLQNQKKQLSEMWKTGKVTDETLKDIELIREPYQCCSLKNVIENSKDLMSELVRELNDVELNDKNNDLYKFKQSGKDLKHLHHSPLISGLRSMLVNDVRPWLEEVTGIELNEDIDMFCANYRYTDHLLCHDDELEGRRIAFIMYFVKDWTEADGGTLDLFRLNENGQPTEVMKQIVPETNALAFFEVTEKSYHQVAEILTKDKSRLSIGGWFHGKPYERPAMTNGTNAEQDVAMVEAEEIDEEEFYAWINPMYLDPEIQLEINAKFEETSEISLPNFLNEEKFKAVSEALSKNKCWNIRGPANYKRYESINDDDEEEESIISQCVKFLRSDATFLMLSNLTGLRLHPLAPEQETPEENEESEEANDEEPSTSTTKNGKEDVNSKEPEDVDPRCKIEVRRWKRGSYTLINDDKAGKNKFCLEGRLFFNSEDYNIEYGGFTSYIAKDEDEELLTTMPEDNTLQLIYKDKQTLGFVKYVNDGINSMPNGEFHDIFVSYYE